jgi:hypothetical protein
MTARDCSDVLGEKACPCCGKHVYSGSHYGTSVYKCANPPTFCEWNRRWAEEHDRDRDDRTPIGRTLAQVRRVHAEFADEVDNAE